VIASNSEDLPNCRNNLL